MDDGNVTPFPLRPHRLREMEPGDLAPRLWLYGTVLIRRHVTVLVAPGGTGKSQLALGFALDLACGRQLLDYHTFERTPVWYLSLEDDEDEVERRVAAFRLVHGIEWDELRDHIYVHNGRERPVCIARTGEDGSAIQFPDLTEIIAAIRSCGIGVMVVDPFVRAHQLNENDNGEMDAAMAAWSVVAEETNCAILLVHHTRKMPATGIEASRGASAVTNAARVGLLLSPMGDAEAGEVGIRPDDRHRFIRLDNAKTNMAPAGAAVWFEMVEVALGNGNAIYPQGDSVSALRRWTKPRPMAMTGPQLCQVFDDLRAGPGDGEQYTLSKTGPSNPRWAGRVLMRVCPDMTEASVRSMLKSWVANGVLVPVQYHSPTQSKPRQGLNLNEGKVAGILNSCTGPPLDEC